MMIGATVLVIALGLILVAYVYNLENRVKLIEDGHGVNEIKTRDNARLLNRTMQRVDNLETQQLVQEKALEALKNDEPAVVPSITIYGDNQQTNNDSQPAPRRPRRIAPHRRKD